MVPARLGEKFVQLGLWAFSELGGGGELEERGRALSCDRQEPGPARNPAGNRGRSGCGRNSRRLMSREQAQELHGLSAKPAASLDADNDEAASPGAGEFRVGLMSLPARCGNDSTARLDISTRVGLAKPREGRHDSGIEGELGPVPERETARKTSMRRASATGTSTRMSASRTLRATLAPASRQTRATACSSGRARVGRTPEVAQAARWSPRGSSCPRQLHLRGASGRGSRKRRSRSTRNKALGRVTSSRVGVTSKARAAKGPAWDSSSAREAGVRSERCISYARLSQAWAASRCQPLKGQRSRGTVLSGRGAGLAGQSGASKPQSQRCCRARIAAVAQGRTPSPRSARSRRSAAAGARAWTTGRVSHQDAQ